MNVISDIVLLLCTCPLSQATTTTQVAAMQADCMYLVCIDSKSISKIPHIDGAEVIRIGSYSIHDRNVVEKEVKRVMSDLAIKNLLTDIPPERYGLIPRLDGFLSPHPTGAKEFDRMFSHFRNIVTENITVCSREVYDQLVSWLRDEIQEADGTAGTAFVEYESCGDAVVQAIENYFSYAGEKLMLLLQHIGSLRKEN